MGKKVKHKMQHLCMYCLYCLMVWRWFVKKKSFRVFRIDSTKGGPNHQYANEWYAKYASKWFVQLHHFVHVWYDKCVSVCMVLTNMDTQFTLLAAYWQQLNASQTHPKMSWRFFILFYRCVNFPYDFICFRAATLTLHIFAATFALVFHIVYLPVSHM